MSRDEILTVDNEDIHDRIKISDHIYVKTGDITKECGDAIVNAANSSLLGGGGVDGAIHRSGGREILNECKKIRENLYLDGLPVGEAVATNAGKLCSNYVIHTVGPIYSSCLDRCEKLLSNCYINSLDEAIRLKCKSISFPAISTGIYGYPKDEAAITAYNSVYNYLSNDDSTIEVTFIFHSQSDCDIFLNAIR